MSKKAVVGADGVLTYIDTTAQDDAQAAVDASAALADQQVVQAEATRKATLTTAPDYQDLLTRAKTATAAQIDTWLTNNVTNLTQARSVLGAVIKVVASRL